jgi:hypothetical protein
LLQVAGAVLLPEPRAEQFHQLQAAQLGGAADQREPLGVPLTSATTALTVTSCPSTRYRLSSSLYLTSRYRP